MGLNLSNLETVIQAKVDGLDSSSTDKDVLLTSKSIEAATADVTVSDIITEGTTQVGNVNTAGTTQVGNVNTAGTTKVGEVNSAGSTQVTAVNNAGTTEVGNVNSAGSTKLAEINAIDTYTKAETDAKIVELAPTEVLTGASNPAAAAEGVLFFNTTNDILYVSTGTEWKKVYTPPPAVISIDDTEVDSAAGGNQTIVITGTDFTSGSTVTFVGANGTDFNASTVTINSETQITAVAPKASFLNAQEPYGVKVTSAAGLEGTLDSQINVDNAPSWNTASGNLATISDQDTGTHATVSATDTDGDAITYSVQSGSIPAGTTLNSSSGVISGDPTDVSSPTTNSFTIRATAGSKTADREFNIVVQDLESSLVNPLTTSGAFGWGNATNFTWSTSGTSGEWGSPNNAASETPATGSTPLGSANAYQHHLGSGDGYIQVDLGSGRSLKVYRTMVTGYSNSHYCLNNYVKGSNDGSNWYNVATWTAHPDNGGNYNRGYLLSGDNSNFFYNYLTTNASDFWITCSNNTAYRFFRLGGSGWNTANSNGYQIVANWWLFGLEG